ncbi:hypothetical protein [Patulibacter minatonensis]|uniref:hypothetical protein n=1 Tax=Patulibacter minatonensis TaxID=298163 RepID=UPI000569BB8F|nr:hypothetical protein [Patulibacter minatonensis]
MDGSSRPRTRARSIAIHLAAACGLGLLVWLAFGRTAFVNYDSAWSLDWMRELIAGGSRPDLGRLFSPTPHPLSDAFSALLVPLSDSGGPAVGRGAETALIVSALLWLGALGVVTFRIAAAWFGVAAGVVAAVLVLTREPVLSYGLRTYLDLPYAVFLLLALLAETKRPRNGRGTVLWITLAGLLRPEAWLLAAAYVAYLGVWQIREAGSVDRPSNDAGTASGQGRSGNAQLSVDSPTAPATGRSGNAQDPVDSRTGSATVASTAPASRLRTWVGLFELRPLLPLIALALVAPLGWIVEGLVLSGDPLQALTGTQQNAADLDRVTGVGSAITVMPRRLGEIVREPVLLAAFGGIVLSLAFLRRRAALGAAGGVAAAVAFFVLAAAGLPLLTRYLVFPATLLIVFATAGLLGWRHLDPDHRWRRPWQAFAVVALLVFVVFTPSQVHRVDRLQSALALQQRVIGDLRTITGEVVSPALTSTAGCAPRGQADLDVALPNHRAVPQVLLWLGLPDDGPVAGTAADERAPGAEPYPAVGPIDTRVRNRQARALVTLLPSSTRVARGFILDKADGGAGLPTPPKGSVRAGTLGTWTVYASDPGCARALARRIAR